MAFVFSLASVLRLRKLATEREERLLQSIHGEIARASETLNRNAAEIEAVYASRDADSSQPLLAADLHSAYSLLDTLHGSRKQLVQHMGKLEQLKERQVVAYSKALQDREALDQIRDQKQSEYDTYIAKQEGKLVDDAFGAKRARNRRQ